MAEEQIQVETSTRDDVTVIALSGRLDAVQAGVVRSKLTDLEADKVVVDMAGIEWIDSSGVGVLVTLFKRVRTEGGDFRVAGLHGQPAEIFRLLRLDTAFKVHGSVDDAVSSL